MSDLNELKLGRVKGRGIIQYASDIMNASDLDIKDTISGIKAISNADRRIQEAILAHEAEQERLTFESIDKTPIVNGEEIAEDLQNGLYR